MSGTIFLFIEKRLFKNKILYAAILLLSMALMISCGKREEKAEPVELMKAEHDRISYHDKNLIKATDQEAEAWYYLAGDELVSLNLPEDVSPWKQEDGYIWITDQNRKIGIMDLNGQIILPCESEKIDYHPEGNVFEQYIRVETGMLIHLTDTEGNLIYESTMGAGNDIKIVSEHAFLIQQDFEYFLIDQTGTPIMADTYTYGSTYKGSGYVVLGEISYVGKPGYKQIYRDDGTPAVNKRFEFVDLTGQKDYPYLAREEETDDFYLMSAEGVPILSDYAMHAIFKDEVLLPLTGTLFYHKRGQELSLLDKNGTVLFQTTYGPAPDGTYPVGRMNLGEESYGLIYGDDRWIVLDNKGREILLETAENADNMLYYGGNLILEYGEDIYRIHNLDTQKVIYEKEIWEEPSIMANYFAVTGPDGYLLYDDSGEPAVDLKKNIQSAYMIDDKVMIIVEEEGKQGLCYLQKQ